MNYNGKPIATTAKAAQIGIIKNATTKRRVLLSLRQTAHNPILSSARLNPHLEQAISVMRKQLLCFLDCYQCCLTFSAFMGEKYAKIRI